MSASAFAGEILAASCPCGYASDELWLGTGLEDPLLSFEIYYCPEWKDLVSVTFDGGPSFGEVLGRDLTPIRNSQQIWDVIAANEDAYQAFRADWRPPDAVAAGGFPSWARVETGRHAGETPPSLLRVQDPLSAGTAYICPRCAAKKLTFRQVGWWD